MSIVIKKERGLKYWVEKGKGRVGSLKLFTRGKQKREKVELFVEEKQEKRSAVLWGEGTRIFSVLSTVVCLVSFLQKYCTHVLFDFVNNSVVLSR